MPEIQFNGTYYSDGQRYRFTQPGVYEVDEAKAEQLLADFPDQFEAVKGAQKDQTAPAEGKSLSKMTKDELRAYAGELGVEVDDEMTNKQLQEAIKAHQEA